jgi:ABC-type multidrug transport system ATPase subunit
MKITLTGIGKKYGREWIFRNVNHTFAEGSATVILGSNGSGKSTLLQVISGYIIPNEGTLEVANGNVIEAEKVNECFAFASPYLELMEEFTFRECVEFQQKFRGWQNGLDANKVIELSGLTHASDKQIRNYSSGMKQRAKLALAILSNAPFLLLDEPCSNLDKQAQDWYATLITDFRENRGVIVCSNAVKEEHFFCDSSMDMMQYKS